MNAASDAGQNGRVDVVFPTVRQALGRCCDLEPDQILLDSRLVADLGMESLDFVELVYELEQAFDITIPMGSLEVSIEEAMGGQVAEVDGILTREGLAKLREMVPGLADDGATEVAVDQVPLMLTVRSVCGLIVLEEQKRTARDEPQ